MTTSILSQAEAPASATVLKLLALILGATLPAIALDPMTGSSRLLLVRIAIPDLVAVVMIITFLLKTKLHTFFAINLYIYALIISLGIALFSDQVFTKRPVDASTFFSEFLALLMASLYCILGHNIGRSRELARYLIIGLLIGVAWQGIIVLHDLLNPSSMWFPDPMEGRIRSTFRAAAQLGIYGFSVAGILLSIGWTLFNSSRARRLIMAAGAAAIVFVIVSSRRTAMISLAVWFATAAAFGIPAINRRGYQLLIVAIVIAGILFAVYLPDLMHTFWGQRMQAMVTSVEEGDDFMTLQLHGAMDNIELWFPFGTGVGRGLIVDPRTYFEMHNAHLALLVELGVFGAFSYYLLFARGFTRDWKLGFGSDAVVVRALVIGLLCGALVGMVHLRFQRERGFALFLGLAPVLVVTENKERAERS